MFNYIKSELYRAAHSLSCLVTLGVFVALAVTITCGLAIFGAVNPDFGYDNTAYAMSFLATIPSVFVCAAPILVYILYENTGRSGVLKNAVAFGISREKIFLSQIIVSFIFCFAVMAATLAVYFAAAFALLDYDPSFAASEVAREVLCVLPSAVASLIFAVVCVNISDRAFVGILLWMAVFYVVPYVCRWIGYEADFFARAASWMPMNFMDSMSNPMFWQTKEGVIKAIVAGAAGTALFAVTGWLALRKKEI